MQQRDRDILEHITAPSEPCSCISYSLLHEAGIYRCSNLKPSGYLPGLQVFCPIMRISFVLIAYVNTVHKQFLILAAVCQCSLKQYL